MRAQAAPAEAARGLRAAARGRAALEAVRSGAAVAAAAGADTEVKEMNASRPRPLPSARRRAVLLVAFLIGTAPPAFAEETFPSPEAAMDAFGSAAASPAAPSTWMGA